MLRHALILSGVILLLVALLCGLIVWEMAQPEFWPEPVPDQREGHGVPRGPGPGFCFSKTPITPFTFSAFPL
jgi:hypothetical protein